MDDSSGFLTRHGLAALFAVVFANQVGLPVPCVPFLLFAGALCATGKMNFALGFGAAVVASLLADLLWYEIGRRRGAGVLQFLCRVSLEPDACVRSTQARYEKGGASILVFAKFVPGLAVVAPPLAGLLGTKLPRFLAFNLAGCVLWAGGYMALGIAFSDQIEKVLEFLTDLGTPLAAVVAVLVCLFAAWKYVARRRFLHKLRIARIAPDDLRRRLLAGDDVFIVDLRGAMDFASDPRTLPRARRIAAEELQLRHAEIPRDRDIVLYCT